MIKFGIYPPMTQRGGDLGRLFEEICAQAQLAEECGFDSCLMGEHHQHREGYLTSPLLVAAAVAARTKRIKVGPCMLLLPVAHPVHVAEDAALVDHISGGRLILGLGLGYQEPDFSAFGIPLRQRLSRFEEGLEILRRAWSEERFSFAGRRYTLQDVFITPKPQQKPHPPLWLGAWSEEGLRRAATDGDAWVIDAFQSRSAILKMVRRYKEIAAEKGREAHIVLMRLAWVAESLAQAQEEFGPALVSFYRFLWRNRAFYGAGDPWLHAIPSAAELTLDRVPLDRFILGAPEDCIAQIEEWHQQAGVEYFLLTFHHPDGPPHEKVMQALRLFGARVIPHFAA